MSDASSSSPAAVSQPASRLTRCAWLPIPLLAAAILAARAAGLNESYELTSLRLVLSAIFYTLVSLVTLVLIGRSFLASGAPGLLLLECGVVLWSLAGTVGDAVFHGDANINVTIFNLGILLAGVCHLAGAILSVRPPRALRAKPLWLLVGCALALGALTLVTWAALEGRLPVFFIQGQGGTPVRYGVLIAAIALFVLSAGLLYGGPRAGRPPFISWYALALLLLAVGLLGIMIQVSLGSVVNWLSRTAQWLAGVYLLLAAVASVRESGGWEMSLEEALRESEHRLAAALEVAQLGIWEYRPDTRRIEFDQRTSEVFGTGAARAITIDAFLAFVHEEDRQHVTADVGAALDPAGAGLYDTEYRIVRRDGAQRWLAARGHAIFTEGGRERQLLRAIGTVMDITARKQAEETVRQSQQTFSELVARSPFGTYIVDSQFRIALMNASSQASAFRNVRPVLGRPFDEAMRILWPEPVAAEIIGHFRHTLETGEPYYSPPFVHPRHDAEIIEAYEWELHRMTLPDGQHGVICYYYDSTKLRTAEAALQEANQRKDEFLATLAHELRNPLAPIRNAAHLLAQEGNGNQALKRSADIIQRQVTHMARLVDDLLDISRIERGKIELKRTRVDFSQSVARAIEVCQPLLAARGHQLTLELPQEALHVDGDPVRLEQMVCNLLSNASKYTAPGGKIHVSAAKEGPEAVLRVRDNGIGLAPEALGKIFDLFYQVDNSIARTEGGLGIGLTLVHRLVRLHGGSVSAASAGLGHGSEFTLRLPIRVPVLVEHSELGAPTPLPAPGRQQHVLVVDDNLDILESMELLLTTSGYRVSVAADGNEALAKARALRPDAALVDLGLPGMSGLEVAQQIRATLGHEILLVAVTGYGQASDKTAALKAGFDAHLVKPVAPDVLVGLLSNQVPAGEPRA